jgi:predicted RNA-binding protein
LCEVKVFLKSDDKLEEFMDNVVSIKPEGDKLLLIDLFGARKYVDAELKEMKLLEHQVILGKKTSK